MESKLTIQKGKQVAISIRDDHEQAKPVGPQLFWYYQVLCLMTLFFSIPSGIFPSKFQTIKQHPGGVFVIMTFFTISVTILATVILLFTSSYLKTYMRAIHYTILKTIGSFSGILAPFFFEVALFVPENPNRIVYSVIGLIFVAIMVGYCFLWKYAISHQQYTEFNESPSPSMLFTAVLIPLVCVSVPFIPKSLYWILPTVYLVLYLIAFVTVIKFLRNLTSDSA